jgi:hypothetical protein
MDDTAQYGDGLDPVVAAAADDFLEARRRVEEAEANLEECRAKLIVLLGEEPVSFHHGGKYFRYTLSRPARSVDVASLLRSGVPMEAFTISKPSITRFLKYAEMSGWSDSKTQQFLIETEDPSTRIARIALTDDIKETN